MHALLHSVPPTLQQATPDPCLRWRLLDTHGQVWVSFLWGHCFFPLGPGAHKVLFVPSKSLFPQSCVSSGSSMVGLMATSSKKAYATPRSAALRAPYLCRRYSNMQRQVWLRLCGVSWWAQSFVWALQTSLVGMRFDSKHNFAPPAILAGASPLPLDVADLFWWDPTFSCGQLFSSEL